MSSDYTIFDIKSATYENNIYADCQNKFKNYSEYRGFLVYEKFGDKYAVYYELTEVYDFEGVAHKERYLVMLDKKPKQQFLKEKLFEYINS